MENSKHAQVLFEQVVYLKEVQGYGKRYLIRAVKFEGGQDPLICIARQWYKADTSEWLPNRHGQFFMPYAPWQGIVSNIQQVAEAIKPIVENESRDGSGGHGHHRDASGRAVPTGADNAVVGATADVGDNTDGWGSEWIDEYARHRNGDDNHEPSSKKAAYPKSHAPYRGARGRSARGSYSSRPKYGSATAAASHGGSS